MNGMKGNELVQELDQQLSADGRHPLAETSAARQAGSAQLSPSGRANPSASAHARMAGPEGVVEPPSAQPHAEQIAHDLDRIKKKHQTAKDKKKRDAEDESAQTTDEVQQLALADDSQDGAPHLSGPDGRAHTGELDTGAAAKQSDLLAAADTSELRQAKDAEAPFGTQPAKADVASMPAPMNTNASAAPEIAAGQQEAGNLDALPEGEGGGFDWQPWMAAPPVPLGGAVAAGGAGGGGSSSSNDTTAPDAPTVHALTTNDTTPTITGTATLGTGETLKVVVNGTTYNNVTVTGGVWSIDTGTATPSSGTLGTFADGNSYEVTATVTNAAGNASTDSSSHEITIDTTAPTVTVTAASIANNGNAVVQSSESGTAYLVKNTLTVNSLADITGAVDNQWNSVAIGTTNTDTNLSVAGLQAGVYKVYAVDAAGNFSAKASSTVVVTNTTSANVMDLNDASVSGQEGQ
ncbi:MAG: hypothetical protein MO847_11990, partial [Candidatus Protistobacter heckmanni]|nr:hypothetical protein [Candidatus Protistobacter heckmanni]